MSEIPQADLHGYLLVCLCDLDPADVQLDAVLGQYEICNKHKAAKLASLASMNCSVFLGRVDENGDFSREEIKQVSGGDQ